MNTTKTLHEYIVATSKKFSELYDTYLSNKYRQERQDRKYKDDESNIFAELKYKNLQKYINKEASLYLEHGMHYEEIKSRLDDLIEDIKSWSGSLLRRKNQRLKTAEELYASEVYFLNDFKIHLEYKKDILDLLIELENFEVESLKNGQDICLDSEYEIYLLNKCILINQVGYCKTNCNRLLKDINYRVNNCKTFNADFYYQLGVINFELQNYEPARKFIEYSIDILEKEIADSDEDENTKCRYNDMLFASYQIQALSYEFCGKPLEAIRLLTISNQEQQSDCASAKLKRPIVEHILELFENALTTLGGIEALHFSNSSTIEEKQQVLKNVKDLISQIEFDSPIFNYVTNPNTQGLFAQIIKSENDSLRNKLKSIIANDINNVDTEKIYQENCIDGSEDFIINEYLHILAHCINELGVDMLKKNSKAHFPKEDYEELSRKLIIISRALMLYVSSKRSVYKTCFATVYAEAGDFQIAKDQLQNCFKEFPHMDVTTKAEIAFFYYIIDGISKISSGSYVRNDESILKLQNRYLNYCYRNFDYDAISHMKLFDFKFQIANILYNGNMKVIIKKFSDIVKDTSNSMLIEFMRATHFQNCNKRLLLDYEKTKYMYNFLNCLLVNSDEDSDGCVERDSNIWNIACKYMHYYNISLSEINDLAFQYIDFSDIDLAIKQLREIFGNLSTDDENFELYSDDCHLIFIKCEDDITKLFNILQEQSSSYKMGFIACANDGLCSACRNATLRLSKGLRFFASIEAGLKEFMLYNTYFVIKKDFGDPKTIFVMTPINTAKSCKYSLSNQIALIEDGLVKQLDKNEFGTLESVIVQYAEISDRIAQEVEWTDDLLTYAKDSISFVLNIFYDKNSRKSAIKYKYYRDSSWGEAVLFKPNLALNILDVLYLKKEPKCHTIECQSPEHLCCVGTVDCRDDKVRELIQSFLEVNLNNCSKLLLWKGTRGPFISWRIVALKNSCAEFNYEDHINEYLNIVKQKICNSGSELETKRINIQSTALRWPTPIDLETSSKPFLFISHFGNDDTIVKSELISFFENNHVPIWYDKERLVEEDSWKNKVKSALEHENCIGCVLLITRAEYFASTSVQDELSWIFQRKKDEKRPFYVYPVIYGFASNNDELESIIRDNVRSRDRMNEVADLVIPKDGKVNTFLGKGQSLYEYTSLEKASGREGSLLQAFRNIKLI